MSNIGVVRKPKLDTNKLDELIGVSNTQSAPSEERKISSTESETQAEQKEEKVNAPTTPTEAKAKETEEKTVQQPAKEENKEQQSNVKTEKKEEGDKEEETIVDLSNLSSTKNVKETYSCEETRRVVLPSLDSILENKDETYANSRMGSITLPIDLLNELQEVALLAKKKAYSRNIMANILTTFFAAYKKDIEAAKRRKNDSK